MAAVSNPSPETIGYVQSIQGSVIARGDDGRERILQVGNAIYMDDIIVTPDDGSITLNFDDDTQINLGANETKSFDASYFTQGAPEFPEQQDEIAALQQALLEGQDISELAPTAAGGTGEDAGNSFVRIDLEILEATPDSGFETDPLDNGFGPIDEDALLENIAPVANPDFNQVDEGAAVEGGFPQTVFGNILENDADFEPGADIAITALSFGAAANLVDGFWTVENNDANGNWVLSVSALTGEYSFSLLEAFPHAIDADSFVLVFDYTITDGRGASSSSALTIDIIDDFPEISDSTVFIDEDDLLSFESEEQEGSGLVEIEPISVDGQVEFSGGADGLVSFGYGDVTAPDGLSSRGDAITYEILGGLITAMAGERTIFTLSLGDSGEYTFTLFDVLDHPLNPDEDDINLTFNVSALDGDGDSASGTITVVVNDDVPVANVDWDWVEVNSYGTYGNVITGYGTDGTDQGWGVDEVSADGTKVTSLTYVDFDGNEQTVALVDGQITVTTEVGGELTMYESGYYHYTPPARSGGEFSVGGISEEGDEGLWDGVTLHAYNHGQSGDYLTGSGTLDLSFNDANDQQLRFTEDGVGVIGLKSPEEIDHHQQTDNSETLIVDFGAGAISATVTVSHLFVDEPNEDGWERGVWEAFSSDGTKVGEGIIDKSVLDYGDSDNVGSFTITLEDRFQYLVFTATSYGGDQSENNDSSDYYVQAIDYTLPGSDIDGFSYTLTDGDGDTDTASLSFSLMEPAIEMQASGFIETGDENDLVYGSYGAETISTDGGNDVVFADSGADFVEGGDGHDVLFGGSGNDEIHGDGGDDTLHGDANNDTLIAGAGNDVVFGGSGDDNINGGSGNDILIGGSGEDTFIHSLGADNGNDIIKDFNLSDDTLLITDVLGDLENSVTVSSDTDADTTTIDFDGVDAMIVMQGISDASFTSVQSLLDDGMDLQTT